MYTWEETNTGTRVDIVRSFAEYDKCPEGDEIPETLKDKECKWERVIGEKIAMTKGQGWGYGKGYWLVLLGSYACTQLQNWLV